MKLFNRVLMVAAATILVQSYAFAGEAPGKMDQGMLVDSKGNTLYTFDNDKDGKSMCNGACAENWPPFLGSAEAMAEGDFTLVTRDDGKKQWAYKGKPLYFFIKDKKPGDKMGDDVKKVWHVVK